MKPVHQWHSTRWGRVARFIGSIKPAIPVLLATAIAMAYATFLESRESADVARRIVFGSWWFIGLMGWICLALIFAVITRYPWKRHHVGFMVVHASLVTIIIGGFISLFTRVEGTMTLEEGTAAAKLEMSGEQIQILVHNAGQFEPDGTHNVTGLPVGDSMVVGVTSMTIVERWANTQSESVVLDDGANPLHAVELIFDGDESDSVWIGETTQDDPRAVLHGVQLRVLPVGVFPEPLATTQALPAPTTQPDHLTFVRGEEVFDVPEVGAELFDGWRVVDLQRFEHALVGVDGLVEGDETRDNPAVLIVLGRDDGSLERHICFERYPEMVSVRPMAGDAESGAILRAGATTPVETPSLPRLILHDADSTGLQIAVYHGTDALLNTSVESLPFTFELFGHEATVRERLTHARQSTNLVAAPPSKENQPALVVEIEEDYERHRLILPWKQPTPYMVDPQSPPLFITFGPPTRELPFALRLEDFRKTDYPGSDRAMAYESDVSLMVGDPETAEVQEARIWMNHPLKHDGWKIYQAGFLGESISIFSIARDPGLWTTYMGSIGLCCGIAIMFYSRRFSRGHPGIPRVHPSAMGVAA